MIYLLATFTTYIGGNDMSFKTIDMAVVYAQDGNLKAKRVGWDKKSGKFTALDGAIEWDGNTKKTNTINQHRSEFNAALARFIETGN